MSNSPKCFVAENGAGPVRALTHSDLFCHVAVFLFLSKHKKIKGTYDAEKTKLYKCKKKTYTHSHKSKIYGPSGPEVARQTFYWSKRRSRGSDVGLMFCYASGCEAKLAFKAKFIRSIGTFTLIVIVVCNSNPSRKRMSVSLSGGLAL